MNNVKLILYGVGVVCGFIGAFAMLANNPTGTVIAIPVAAVCIAVGQRLDR